MRLAIFDLDGTLIDGDSHVMLLRGLLGDAAVPLRVRLEIVFGAAAWAVGLLDNTWTKAVAARAFAGWSEARLGARMEAFAATRVLPRLRPKMVEEVRAARRAGRFVVLLSASLQPVVEIVAREVGADLAVGARLAIEDGVVTGRLAGAVPREMEKVRAIERLATERGADLAASSSWGDAFADRFVLARVGEPHAVTPDRRLRAYARERGWPIVER